MKTLNVMDVKEDDVLSRNEMKAIMAGSGGSGSGYACTYIVSGSWTGRLKGCYTRNIGVPPYSVSEEVCRYEAYDPYNLGYEGSRVINGAVARQC